MKALPRQIWSCSLVAVSAVLMFASGVAAQDASGGAPATQPSAALAGAVVQPASDAAPTREEWEQLKKEQQDLRHELEQLRQERAAAAERAPSENQPMPPAAPGEPAMTGNRVNEFLGSLFKPRTEQQYFAPLEKMNPEHIRPDIPLEIGRLQDLSLNLGVHTVGRLQAITQENVAINGVEQDGLNPGFQNPFGSLSFLATIPDKFDVYFDLYIASRPHPNTMYAHEGYLLFKRLPEPFDTGLASDIFDYINVKVGAFDIDFGDNNYHRSNNAFVDRNPLIGNPLVDPNVEEIGGEVYSIKGPVYWLFGFGSGTTTEHFDFGAGASAMSNCGPIRCPRCEPLLLFISLICPAPPV